VSAAIREGELRHLDPGVQRVDAAAPHRREVEALEEPELLQQHGTLAPGRRLPDARAAVVELQRLLDAPLVARQVVGAQQPGVGLAAGVAQRLAEEALDRLRTGAAVEVVARGADARLAASRREVLRLGERPEPACQGGVGLALPDVAQREVHLCTRGPLVPEAVGHEAEHHVEERVHGEAALGQAARRRHHLGERARAEVFQEQTPGVERCGNRRRQESVGRDELHPQRAHPLDAGCGRRRTLTRDRDTPILACLVDQHGHLAAGAVLMGLEHLEREAHRARGVGSVAAVAEHAGTDLRRQIVARADGAAVAPQRGARGEAHAVSARSSSLATMTSPRCAPSGASAASLCREFDRPGPRRGCRSESSAERVPRLWREEVRAPGQGARPRESGRSGGKNRSPESGDPCSRSRPAASTGQSGGENGVAACESHALQVPSLRPLPVRS
jgi:hypothetical protein